MKVGYGEVTNVATKVICKNSTNSSAAVGMYVGNCEIRCFCMEIVSCKCLNILKLPSLKFKTLWLHAINKIMILNKDWISALDLNSHSSKLTLH